MKMGGVIKRCNVSVGALYSDGVFLSFCVGVVSARMTYGDHLGARVLLPV